MENHIEQLLHNEIFVFGSNIDGRHAGGAARDALEKFGAIYGKGVGIQGQSYAIPTMGNLETLGLYARDFLDYALTHPDKTFYLTRVGCGIANHTDEEVAPFFADASSNVVRPRGW